MIHMFRQLAMILVVTLVSMGVAASAGNAAMDLQCDMLQTQASGPAAGDHADHLSGNTSKHSFQTAVFVEDHVHGEDTSSEGHKAHCKAHACPVSAVLDFSDVTQPFIISRTLDVAFAAPLMELTVSEGLRRPPRA